MFWQLDPAYGRYFRDFGRYLNLPELECLPQQTGAEVLMFCKNDKTVESIGMNSLKPYNAQVVESGLMLDKNYHNTGVGAEFMKEVENYCFKIRGFRKIISFVCASDEKVLRHAEVVGFKVEGRLTNFTFYDGKYEDAVLIAKGV